MTGNAGGAGQPIAPRLRGVQVGVRSDLEISRQLHRGRPVYVVTDPVSFRSHVVEAGDYELLVAIRGDVTLGETFETMVDRGLVDPASEERFYGFVLELHSMGFLNLPVSSHEALWRRHRRARDARRRGLLLGWLSLRIPVWNPDAFLGRTLPLARGLFTPAAFALWIVLLALAALVAAGRRHDIVDAFSGLFDLAGLGWLWVILIALKLVHELGHGWACRLRGGHVPEMGVFMILLTPCAYVDASAAWSFPRTRDRMLVNLAGMYVEMFFAAGALLLWAMLEPGLGRELAFKVAVTASITTIGFNLNPLMKFDGYYVLSDLLEIPNLQGRSSAVLRDLGRRIFVGLPRVARETGRLRALLLGYGVAAFAYRATLILSISILLATRFGRTGLLLAGVYLATGVLAATGRTLRWLVAADETAPVRARAVAVALLLVAAPVAVLGLVPAPSAASADGVTERADEAVLHARAGGRVERVLARRGEAVAAGDPILVLRAPELDEERRRLAAELDALRVRREVAWAARGVTPETVRGLDARVAWIERALADVEERLDALVVRADRDGILRDGPDDRWLGRPLAAGDPVATIMAGPVRVRAVLSADVATATAPVPGDAVRLQLRGRPAHAIAGRVIEVAPTGVREIPAELTGPSGGPVPVDRETGLAAEAMFEVVIEPGAPLAAYDGVERPDGPGASEPAGDDVPAGLRVAVAFDEGSERESVGTVLRRRFLAFVHRIAAG